LTEIVGNEVKAKKSMMAVSDGSKEMSEEV